jgi:hypothetical protein
LTVNTIKARSSSRSEPLLYLLESEANLGICHGIIVLRECLVVDERILGKDADSLADVEVQTCLILGSLHVALAVRLIHVVTRLHVDTAVLWQLSQWGDNQSIYTLCLVADFCIQIAVLGVGIVVIGDALGKSLAGRVDILRTYGPTIFLVFEREGVAVLVQAAGTAESLFYRFSILVKNGISSSIFFVDDVSLFIIVPCSLSCIRTGPSVWRVSLSKVA